MRSAEPTAGPPDGVAGDDPEACLSREVVVVGPLLTTKLHVPRRRRGLVARPRLSERLSHGDEAALTLVSAPAGFGKTTVLTEWLGGAPQGGRSGGRGWLGGWGEE